MPESQAPPPIQNPQGAPPVMERSPFPPASAPPKPKGFFQKLWGGFVAFVAAVWKIALPVFKLAKGAKILLTAGSMLLSVGFYAMLFGWKFAVGIVLCIFVHEMGHVTFAAMLGQPVSAPIFIPGFGALILQRQWTKTPYEEALIGYGGPLFGAFSGFACWGLFMATGNQLFLGVAMFSFMINLFNMIPIFPLDGGWILGSISPYMWLIGMAGMIALIVEGYVRNPFIFIIILLSLPTIIRGFKTGSMHPSGAKSTPSQKLGMGVAYVVLCGALFWSMGATSQAMVEYREQRTRHSRPPALMTFRGPRANETPNTPRFY